jgi:predicted GNAT family acetyltransferase
MSKLTNFIEKLTNLQLFSQKQSLAEQRIEEESINRTIAADHDLYNLSEEERSINRTIAADHDLYNLSEEERSINRTIAADHVEEKIKTIREKNLNQNNNEVNQQKKMFL